MRNTVKFLILYALWYGYNVCGYAQFTMQTVDNATVAMVVHTFQITGTLNGVNDFYKRIGLIYDNDR